MFRALWHRVALSAGVIVVLSGLLDTRAWGDFTDSAEASGKATGAIHGGTLGPLELLHADPTAGRLSTRTETLGRANYMESRGYSATAASIAYICDARPDVLHVSAVPQRHSFGPAGSNYPLLLGYEAPHAESPLT